VLVGLVKDDCGESGSEGDVEVGEDGGRGVGPVDAAEDEPYEGLR